MTQLPQHVAVQQQEREEQPQEHEGSESGLRQPLEERHEVVQELRDEDRHPLRSVQKALQERRMGWNGRRDCSFEPKFADK